MPLIPAARRQRQVNPCKFQISLVYVVSSRTARAVQRYVMVLACSFSVLWLPRVKDHNQAVLDCSCNK